MREHPIPQDVTGYKFHIIGNMTLKQFAELGLAVFICVILYNTNLFFVIKWPLIAIIAGMGFLVAFVPIAERPLDHWIITFIRILYKPTKYYWKREPKIPDAFLYKPPQFQNQSEIEIDLTPARQQRVRDFFSSINNSKTIDPWEVGEKNRINEILNSFSSVDVKKIEATQQKTKPNLGVRVRKLKPSHAIVVEKELVPEMVVFSQNTSEQTNHQKTSLKNTAIQASEVARQVEIPELQTISLKHEREKEAKNPTNLTTSQENQNYFVSQENNQAQNTLANIDSKTITENISLPFPTKPTEPNKIVGMVLSQNNKLLTNSIVEIKDESGKIVRAVISNTLGQFSITTALKNGKYLISVEKDGYSFKPLNIEINGRIIDPVEIRSEQ